MHEEMSKKEAVQRQFCVCNPTINVFKCLSWQQRFFQMTVPYIVFNICQYSMKYNDIHDGTTHNESSRKKDLLWKWEELNDLYLLSARTETPKWHQWERNNENRKWKKVYKKESLLGTSSKWHRVCFLSNAGGIRKCQVWCHNVLRNFKIKETNITHTKIVSY